MSSGISVHTEYAIVSSGLIALALLFASVLCLEALVIAVWYFPRTASWTIDLCFPADCRLGFVGFNSPRLLARSAHRAAVAQESGHGESWSMSQTSKHGFDIASLYPYFFPSRSACPRLLNSSASTTTQTELKGSISFSSSAFSSSFNSRDILLITVNGSPSTNLNRTLPLTPVSSITVSKYSVSVTFPFETIRWRFRFSRFCFLRPLSSPRLLDLAMHLNAFPHILSE